MADQNASDLVPVDDARAVAHQMLDDIDHVKLADDIVALLPPGCGIAERFIRSSIASAAAEARKQADQLGS